MAFEKANYRDVTHSAPNSLGSAIGNQALLNSVDIDKSSCIQFYRYMPRVYLSGMSFTWTRELVRKVELGRIIAVRKIGNVQNNLKGKRGKPQRITETLERVLNILCNDELTIYPLMPGGDLLGASWYDVHEMSINVGMEPGNIAKTLIHEALHILGSWFRDEEYEEEEDGVTMIKVRKVLRPNEEYCSDDKSASYAYRKVNTADPLISSPDYLAQFVMMS